MNASIPSEIMKLKSEPEPEPSTSLSFDTTTPIDVSKPDSESWDVSVTEEPKRKSESILQKSQEEENEKGILQLLAINLFKNSNLLVC